MNENRPDEPEVDAVLPQGDSKPEESVPRAAGDESNPSLGDDSESARPAEEMIVATLVEGEAPIRAGSPFLVDPQPEAPSRQFEPLLDVGPLKYTAMGAVAAAGLVLVFAMVAAWWFPAGGALIAALGCVLSIFGIYSHFRLIAGGLLTVHLCLFVYSYGQTM